MYKLKVIFYSMTKFGEDFSVMQPGTHVWPHTGPTNCRLRMHLGLIIPRTGCRILLGGNAVFKAEGKVLIFDDSFEHEVWQDADTFRLIFIVDVWHPELNFVYASSGDLSRNKSRFFCLWIW
uniref:Aspartyl/asparaginy/proline hydroxylase domain-containing protein n=1 Tax=Astyanax mexicanus TaxID=7994 RepID=A0A8B9KUS4_ASTMX